MSRITLSNLKAINQASIRRAGARYTPTIDPNAPNLEIRALITAIDALSQSLAYRDRLAQLEKDLRAAWAKAPAEIKALFDKKLASAELGANLLARMQKADPGAAGNDLSRLDQLLKNLRAKIEPYEAALYDQMRNADGKILSRDQVNAKIHDVRELERPLNELGAFIDAPDFQLIKNNRLLLRGGWGTGKTHLLCDIAKSRTDASLPTLFVLGQTLARRTDPLVAICQATGLAKAPPQLLRALDRIGKRNNCRALLMIDGINEGDRAAWQRHMASVVRRVQRHKNLALIVSCRTPFEEQVMTSGARKAFVEAVHTGFEDIEFDAQREFFRHYKIPAPHIPLLAPEFSRPLFLKILCETVSKLGQKAKHKRINDFASGHKGMTKLLEDFVFQVGSKIEADFKLPAKTCWTFLKGHGDGAAAVGIAPRMAELGLDYISRSECLAIAAQVTSLAGDDVEAFFARMMADGLLAEDGIYGEHGWANVVRLPYQRFSDHLISRHLLGRYLDTRSGATIRRSFYVNRPLGRIFKQDRFGQSYAMPGIASAVMLEFPERIKRVSGLDQDNRELIYFLPKSRRGYGWAEAFMEGLLWRSTDSFCRQTDHIVSHLISSGSPHTQREILEVLVCLASRTGHPYSGSRLYRNLALWNLIERDLLWGEFIRQRHAPSAVYRVLDWILSSDAAGLGEETASNLIWLCACLLTTTVRPLRDRATRCLVVLGDMYPQALLGTTLKCLDFNDPYLPERMLAASYGVLMRNWAFPSAGLADAAVELATELHRRLIGSRNISPIEHYLMRDYATGIVTLTAKVAPRAKRRLRLDGVPVSKKSLIPPASRIGKKAVKPADRAIHMDFDNYTTGRLVEGRHNYDSKHKEYQRVQRQIRWRILNLGYDAERFKSVDDTIGSSSHYARSDNGGKVDRYGKKYSWIAFFEVAGRRRLNGTLPDRDEIRISDTDVDPSFPDPSLEWKPPVKQFFKGALKSAPDWMGNGPDPDYRELLARQEVDGIVGPWVLVHGFIGERASKDAREAFTFLRGLFVAPDDLERLKKLVMDTEYPGNMALPDPAQEHYLFAGEIGWSPKFGKWFRRKDGRAKPQLREAFDRTEFLKIDKPYGTLSRKEKAEFNRPRLTFLKDPFRVTASKPTRIPATQMVEIETRVDIPGVKVELPSIHFAWESYHSEENADRNPDYPAPALVEKLGLRKKGAAVDLVDWQGKPGMLCREIGKWRESFRSHLLYIRADLIQKYLGLVGRRLAWINWGEREIDYKVVQNLRDDPEMRAVWDTHAHIHKQFVVWPGKEGQQIRIRRHDTNSRSELCDDFGVAR